MKTIMSAEKYHEIETIVEIAERMKNYREQPPQNSIWRKSFEKRNSHDVVMWHDGKHSYSACYETICSRHGVWSRGLYTKDGKTTTINAIRNSLNRLYPSVFG